jgi:hypothetical protein
MKKEAFIRRLAGTMVLIGTAGTYWLSPWSLVLLLFVGINLIQSTYTGICPAETLYDELLSN